MKKPSVDFNDIKSLLLSSENFNLFIKSEEMQEKAMFLFWALDSLSKKDEKLSDGQTRNLKRNERVLKQSRDFIVNNTLQSSFKNYSFGFILGTLEFAARMKEAQIDFYSEYRKLVAKIEQMEKYGFPNEKFQKYWEETILGINEIAEYLKSRSENYYPVLAQIVNLYVTKKDLSSLKSLKILRKGRKDNLVFQILSGVLHSNPILYKKIKNLCIEKEVSIDELIIHFFNVLQLLAIETKNRKVRGYCELLLKYRNQKESID